MGFQIRSTAVKNLLDRIFFIQLLYCYVGPVYQNIWVSYYWVTWNRHCCHHWRNLIWHYLQDFCPRPPLLIGSSDLINQTKRPILPIKQNFQAYNSDRQNVQSYRSEKISQVSFHTNVRDYCSEKMYELIVQTKCTRLFVRYYQPNKTSELIRSKKCLSLFLEYYSYNLLLGLIFPYCYCMCYICTHRNFNKFGYDKTSQYDH